MSSNLRLYFYLISNKRNIGKYAKSKLAVEGRLDRINKTKQNAAKKKAQMLRNKRYAAGSAHGPQRLVTVLSLFAITSIH